MTPLTTAAPRLPPATDAGVGARAPCLVWTVRWGPSWVDMGTPSGPARGQPVTWPVSRSGCGARGRAREPAGADPARPTRPAGVVATRPAGVAATRPAEGVAARPAGRRRRSAADRWAAAAAAP